MSKVARKHEPSRVAPRLRCLDKALEEILRHIAVPKDVLGEAKARRNLVCELAMRHPAARATWYSGSIAHGTHNSPLGDADCGVMVDRRSLEFRAYGPDAEGAGLGPEVFIQTFAETMYQSAPSRPLLDRHCRKPKAESRKPKAGSAGCDSRHWIAEQLNFET